MLECRPTKIPNTHLRTLEFNAEVGGHYSRE
jgi:hypothetical protein